MLHCISLPSFCIVLVALQFPEGLLMFACTIADILERYIVWLTSIILRPILDTLFKFLTPKKGEYFGRVEICQQRWNCEEPLK